MKDGTIAEYNFGTIAGIYSNHWVSFGRPDEFPEIQIFTDSVDNIDYIKLSKVSVCDERNLHADYIPCIEFELYNAE